MFFNLGIEVCETADRAADFSHGNGFASALQPHTITPHLAVPQCESQSKRSWLCVDAVSASNLWREFEFKGASF